MLAATLPMYANNVVKADTNKTKLSAYRNTLSFGICYARHFPLKDMALRFGGNNSIGISANYKFNRNINLQLGFDGLFGSKVYENTAIDSIIGGIGEMIDNKGNLAVLHMYERGYDWHINVGKVFPISRMQLNSGILLSVGLGFIQHKIKYVYPKNTLPQLDNNYVKGYDRLTNGLMYRGFAGYQQITNNGYFNFYAGIEYLYGITYNRRAINYDTRVHDFTRRKDILIGPKIGILIKLNTVQSGNNKKEVGTFFE